MLVIAWSLAITLARGQSADPPPSAKLDRVISSKPPISNAQIRFVGQGANLIVVGEGGVRQFDVKTGEVNRNWEGPLLALAISADEATLATIDNEAQVRLWDLKTGKLSQQFKFQGDKAKQIMGWPNDTASLSFSPDGKLLAVGYQGHVESWDLSSNTMLHRYLRPNGHRFWAVEFLPDNESVLVTGFPAYNASVWNARTGKEITWVLLFKYLRCATLSSDGKALVTGINFGVLRHSLGFPRIVEGDERPTKAI
jgi:WD40 repeat protein